MRKKPNVGSEVASGENVEWSDGTSAPYGHFERDVIDWKIENVVNTWKQIEALQAAGKVKSIGVSNFSEKMLKEFLPKVTVVPAVNQLELHLYNPDHGLVAFMKTKGIVAEAYSPLGSTGAPLLQDEVVGEIAKKYSLQPADVCLGWMVAKDIVILPKSVTNSRIKANLDGTEKAAALLDKTDIGKLDKVAADGKRKRLVNPPWGVDLGFN
jgi:glycerol 2-dehydrogenase (NADP+)